MEIEFRGKRTSDGVWVYGYYVSNPRGVLIDVIYCKEDAHEVLPETVSLFIGETNCNGKKLYEHDILRYITSTGENHYKTIKFTPERAAFCGANVAELKYEEFRGIWGQLTQEYINNLKLDKVGNIFDNPDLLIII